MKLGEFQIDQFRAGAVRHAQPVAGIFPGIRCDAPGLAAAAGGEDHGLGLKDHEPPGLAPIPCKSRHTGAVQKKVKRRTFHMRRDTLMNTKILQGADHLQARTVTDVGKTRIAMAAEIALAD